MKKRVKRKFNLLKFIMFLLSLLVIYLVISYFLSIKTKNIIILNNSYYSDEQIIETAGIENYPKFILLNKNKIKKKLLKLDLIEDVTISKKLGFILSIEVKEKKILYLVRSTNKYKDSKGNNYQTNDILLVPTLINYVPEDIEKKFIKALSDIDSNVISLISEIEYSKNDYDDSRFIFYMIDGNEVYVTTSRLNLFDKYISIVTKLNKRKGILYLDSGNYFVIKER